MTDTAPDSPPDTSSTDTDAPVDADPAEGAPADSSGAPSGSDTAGAPSGRNAEKDPSDWVTGGEPMTGPQGSYLGTLAREAGEDVPDDLTKAEASEQIERLQSETGRGA